MSGCILGYLLCVSHIGMTYGGSPSKGREKEGFIHRPGQLNPGHITCSQNETEC